MTKAKFALTALMIGTLTVTGASFAEAEVKLDDVKIGVHFKNDHRPPAPDSREAPGSHHGKPAPRPVHRYHHVPPHHPHGPGHHVPPPPPHRWHR